MLSEQRKEQIKKEARAIMDNFGKALDNTNFVPEVPEKSVRMEGSGSKSEGDFKKRILSNAPNNDGDCIIAEKASW